MSRLQKSHKRKGGSKNCHLFEYATSQEAWADINRKFLTKDKDVFDGNSAYNSGISVLFNVFIKIRKAWVDPDFDFGKMFNYKEQKWTILINNYLDLNKLDILRSKVRYFDSRYNQNYNLSYTFENKHDNGKGCLLAITLSRRIGTDIPVITMVLRSSEITKRLIFDLLLVQRMGEYIYGNTTFSLEIYATQMYCNTETVLMYNSYEPVLPLIESSKDGVWAEQAKSVFNKFFTNPEAYTKYKVYLRAVKSINPKAFNHKSTPLLAKNLYIYDKDIMDIEFPISCISLKDRRKFLNKLKK